MSLTRSLPARSGSTDPICEYCGTNPLPPTPRGGARMAREQDLLNAFIEFADTFVDDYDIVEFLHRLAERCVGLVNASEAGIMLADRAGELHYVASSSERMRLIELFELQHDEGPCLDAYREGIAVHSTLDESAHTRWAR